MTALVGARAYRTLTSDEETELSKYDLLKLHEPTNGYPELVFETEPGTSMGNMATQELHELGSQTYSVPPQEDNILSEVDGVIDRIEEKTVRVKLYPKTYANFPYILFTDTEKIRQGQHIKYLIKKAEDGYRYQEIVPVDNTQQHPEKEEIFRLLDEFKYRDA